MLENIFKEIRSLDFSDTKVDIQIGEISTYSAHREVGIMLSDISTCESPACFYIDDENVYLRLNWSEWYRVPNDTPSHLAGIGKRRYIKFSHNKSTDILEYNIPVYHVDELPETIFSGVFAIDEVENVEEEVAEREETPAIEAADIPEEYPPIRCLIEMVEQFDGEFIEKYDSCYIVEMKSHFFAVSLFGRGDGDLNEDGCIDWLADEEPFGGEDPLWFSTCSHCTSPLTDAQTYATKWAEANKVRVQPIALLSDQARIINLEDISTEWAPLDAKVCYCKYEDSTGIIPKFADFLQEYILGYNDSTLVDMFAKQNVIELAWHSYQDTNERFKVIYDYSHLHLIAVPSGSNEESIKFSMQMLKKLMTEFANHQITYDFGLFIETTSKGDKRELLPLKLNSDRSDVEIVEPSYYLERQTTMEKISKDKVRELVLKIDELYPRRYIDSGYNIADEPLLQEQLMLIEKICPSLNIVALNRLPLIDSSYWHMFAQGAKFMITFHMILAEDVESYLPLWHDKIAETNQKLESETTLSRNYNLVILHPEIYEQIREGVEKEYETSFSKIIYCSLNNLNEKLLKLLLT